MLFPFLLNWLRSFGRVSLSLVLVLVFLLGCRLLFFSFSFLDLARGGRVEVRRWTTNPLARLRSTPEDLQPFTSLMVSQSAYLRDIGFASLNLCFIFNEVSLGFPYIFFKNE